MDEMFRRFFGFGDGRSRNHGHGYPHHDEDDEYQRDNFFNDRRGGLDDMFDHFHRDLFHQMDSIHRQMEDMMRGFGPVDFSSEFPPKAVEPDVPRQEETPEKRIFSWSSPSPFFHQRDATPHTSPRDFMLKDPEQDSVIDLAPEKPEHKFGRNTPPRMGDTDLDGKISEDKLFELIKKLPEQQDRKPLNDNHAQGQKPWLNFSGRSVSVSTVTGPDGRSEQTRTVRDSSGREESTVTQSIGDKSYSVTTITDEKGAREKHEKLQNMDEGDLGKFKQLWSKPQTDAETPVHVSPADSMIPPLNPDDRSLFFKLFGRGGH